MDTLVNICKSVFHVVMQICAFLLVWRKENINRLSLCYSIVYYYNVAQSYEQFLQVGRLYLALILLGLALYFLVFIVGYTLCLKKCANFGKL